MFNVEWRRFEGKSFYSENHSVFLESLVFHHFEKLPIFYFKKKYSYQKYLVLLPILQLINSKLHT